MPSPAMPYPRSAWADLSARAELSNARRRVLELVERSEHPMSAAEVGDALDLHHNTVREHLDALVEAGFVSVSTRSTGRRGRPALQYASTAPDPALVLNSYLTLLDAVAQALDDDADGSEKAFEIGRQWARLTPEPESRPQGDGVEQLIPQLAALGFAPAVAGEDDVVLKACPLVTSDRGPSALVCRMHEGFLNEMQSRLGAGGPADPDGRTTLSVIPLRPDGCHVSAVGNPSGASAGA